MGGPSEEPAASPPEPPPRDEIRVVEASASRERTCAGCGTRTSSWKPVRRRRGSVLLCLDCAAKPELPEGERCPSCGADLRPGDRFCGKCATPIDYGCPSCGAAVDADDLFCRTCGTRLA